MNIARVLALLAACCTLAAAAQGLSKDEYKAQRVRVQDRLATSKDRCSSLAGHSREVCKAQAQAEYDTARAELMARYKPSPRNLQNAELAKAKGALRVALEKCGDLEGAARKICRDDAKATFTAARAQAQAGRVARDNGTEAPQTLHARDQARETATQARFDAERERCDTLSGDAKANCMADAKKRYAIQ